MGVESLDGSKSSGSAEEPRLYRLVGPIDEDEFYRLMGSVDMGVNVKFDASLEKRDLGAKQKIGASSSADEVLNPRVMSSARVVGGSSLGEASGSMSVSHPSPKGSLSLTKRGRKRPCLLADLSWGKESKEEKLGLESGVSTSAGIPSDVVQRVEEEASEACRPVESEVKIAGQTVLGSETVPSVAGSIAEVGDVGEGDESSERPRKMSKVSGEAVSNEESDCGTGGGGGTIRANHFMVQVADRDLYHSDLSLGGDGGPIMKSGVVAAEKRGEVAGEAVVVLRDRTDHSSSDDKSTREEVLGKGGEVEGVAVVVAHDRTDHSSMNDKSTREEEVLETRYHDATANLLPGGGYGGMELGEGRVPSTSVDDPKGWGDLLRRVPEVGPSSTGDGVDLDATYDEFASSIFRLVGIKNRAMREYESAARRSKGNLARLEEQIAELRRLNDDLSEQKAALVGSRDEERCLRKGVEDSLREKTIELEAVKVGLERAESQARLKEEEVRILGLRLEKAGEDKGEVEGLREKVARLEGEAAKHKGEIIAMDQGCRATLRRLLKQQAAALYSGYEAKNGCMGLKLDHFLESRAQYDKVAEELHRAEGALNALKSLKEKDGVPVPDSKFAELKTVVDFQRKRAGNHAVEEFHSGKLLLGLPEGIGAVDVERLDFKSARYTLVREEDESSADAAEGETEESPTVGSEGDEGGRI